MSIFQDKESALAFLKAGRAFFDIDEDEPQELELNQCLNMNDTFAWALAYGPRVPDECLIEVADLFLRYGNCGLCYWCTIHPDPEERILASEFEDVQRGIEFVRYEEELRRSMPESNKRAYHKLVYKLGERTVEKETKDL